MAKKLWIFLLIAVFGLGLAQGAWAAAPSKDEVRAMKAKVAQAAQYLAQKGPEALKEFNDPQSKWAAEPYIFAYKLDGTCLALPYQPELVGTNRLGLKDNQGRAFVAQMVKTTKAGKQQGWVEYNYQHPDKLKAPAIKKAAWVMRVPGQEMFVGAGLYGVTKSELTTWGKGR
jgi:polar amino acid transport system substrate-binding protein